VVSDCRLPTAAILFAALALCGCAVDPRDFNREPHMTAVGSGLHATREQLPTDMMVSKSYAEYHSIWSDDHADLFRDPRAMRVGDVVTVTISIDDKAELDNESDRSRDASSGSGLGFNYKYDDHDADFKANANVNSSTSSKGQGAIDRSEKIELSVAGVVTEVLPNGNLMISGSQEVRVNFELRILNIAGIIRPRDISTNNTIPYNKIAEARISYGGRGRITEVQQPGWGQQLRDIIAPY
jgi:flagellar L-ring protein precursor FlgH